MTDLETKQPAPTSGQVHEGLQLQLTLQLLALILLTATVTFAFFGQWRRARYDLTIIKPPALNIIQGFEQEKPGIDTFLAKLVEYGRTHPDFAPIVQKYGLQYQPAPGALPKPGAAPSATIPAPKPATAPAPAPASKK